MNYKQSQQNIQCDEHTMRQTYIQCDIQQRKQQSKPLLHSGPNCSPTPQPTNILPSSTVQTCQSTPVHVSPEHLYQGERGPCPPKFRQTRTLAPTFNMGIQRCS